MARTIVSRGLNRRDFLKGAAAAGCAIGIGLPALALAKTDSSSSADASAASASTAGDGDTRVVNDLSGIDVTIPADVERVAALTGPVYETIIMLGAADKVVLTGNAGAASGWGKLICPEYSDITVVDDATNPNLEQLVASGVQVMLFWDAYPEVTKKVEDLGIPVVVTQLENDGISDVPGFVELKKHEIMTVGQVFGGAAEEKAQKWCGYADEVVDYVTSRTSTLTEDEIPSVYYIRGPEATSIHGGESYTRYLVDMAGGSLVSKDEPQLLFNVTMEEVIKWNPEYIFMGRVNNTDLVLDDPNFAPVKAVQDGNVYVNLHGICSADYGTDCFLLMEQIAKILHPDLFEDLDMVEEVKNYYHDFYEYDLTDDQANRILNYQDPEE